MKRNSVIVVFILLQSVSSFAGQLFSSAPTYTDPNGGISDSKAHEKLEGKLEGKSDDSVGIDSVQLVNSLNHSAQNNDPGFDVSPFHLYNPKLAPVDFYRKSELYFEFTNFAEFSVTYDKVVYPTSEHAFQAQKFLSGSKEALAFSEVENRFPSKAFALGRAKENLRFGTDWKAWDKNRDRFMYAVVFEKFNGNEKLKQLLLSTGDKMITEWTSFPGGDERKPIDMYWGTNRHTNQGKNHLGKILMLVRAVLGQSISEIDAEAVLQGLINDNS